MTVDAPTLREADQESVVARSGSGRSVAWVVLAVVSIVWLRMVRDAWRIRSIVMEYKSAHDSYDLGPSPWPEHLRTFHNDLMGVGADYFYPFAWGLIVAIGLLWIGTAAIATANSRWRWGTIAAGAGALLLQLVLLGPALVDYINVTD